MEARWDYNATVSEPTGTLLVVIAHNKYLRSLDYYLQKDAWLDVLGVTKPAARGGLGMQGAMASRRPRGLVATLLVALFGGCWISQSFVAGRPPAPRARSVARCAEEEASGVALEDPPSDAEISEETSLDPRPLRKFKPKRERRGTLCYARRELNEEAERLRPYIEPLLYDKHLSLKEITFLRRCLRDHRRPTCFRCGMQMLRPLLLGCLRLAVLHALRTSELSGSLPTKEQVSEIADSAERCVIPMEGDTGLGLVCKHDLASTSAASSVQCVMCGQLFGSEIVPMESCVVQTQPYKWLLREYSEIKIKVSTRKANRLCRGLITKAPGYRWGSLSCNSELSKMYPEVLPQASCWAFLPQFVSSGGSLAKAPLTNILNAEVLNRKGKELRHLLYKPRVGLPVFTEHKVRRLMRRAKNSEGVRINRFVRPQHLPPNAPGAPYAKPIKDVYAEVPPLWSFGLVSELAPNWPEIPVRTDAHGIMVNLKLPLLRRDAKATGTNDNSPRTTATASTAASSQTSAKKGGGKSSTGFLASAAGIQRQSPNADAALKVQPSAGKGRWHEAYLQEFLQKMEEDPDAFEEDIKKSRALRDHRLEQANEHMESYSFQRESRYGCRHHIPEHFAALRYGPLGWQNMPEYAHLKKGGESDAAPE
ncbi:unnamed protein product, partial [Symbiodinium sp. KB8]